MNKVLSPIVATQIARMVCGLRRMPDVDVERISYRLTDDEWREFADWLARFEYGPRTYNLHSLYKMQYMGVAVYRERPGSAPDAHK